MDETHPLLYSWAGSSIVPPHNSRTFRFPNRRTVPTKKLTPCSAPPRPHPTFCLCTWLYGPHLEPHLIPLTVFVLLFLDIVKGPHTLGRTCQYPFFMRLSNSLCPYWYIHRAWAAFPFCLWWMAWFWAEFWAGYATTINLKALVANSPCRWTSRNVLHPPTLWGYFFFGNMKIFNAELL